MEIKNKITTVAAMAILVFFAAYGVVQNINNGGIMGMVLASGGSSSSSYSSYDPVSSSSSSSYSSSSSSSYSSAISCPENLCLNDSDCDEGEYCSPYYQCETIVECEDDEECPLPLTCQEGTCQAPPIDTPESSSSSSESSSWSCGVYACRTTSDCDPGETCDNWEQQDRQTFNPEVDSAGMCTVTVELLTCHSDQDCGLERWCNAAQSCQNIGEPACANNGYCSNFFSCDIPHNTCNNSCKPGTSIGCWPGYICDLEGSGCSIAPPSINPDSPCNLQIDPLLGDLVGIDNKLDICFKINSYDAMCKDPDLLSITDWPNPNAPYPANTMTKSCYRDLCRRISYLKGQYCQQEICWTNMDNCVTGATWYPGWYEIRTITVHETCLQSYQQEIQVYHRGYWLDSMGNICNLPPPGQGEIDPQFIQSWLDLR